VSRVRVFYLSNRAGSVIGHCAVQSAGKEI
jgi:hypothetical protein